MMIDWALLLTPQDEPVWPWMKIGRRWSELLISQLHEPVSTNERDALMFWLP
jgi:hypothetical protein